MFRLRAHGKKPITITTTAASNFLYWSPVSSPTVISSPVAMDPIIWSGLPDHLLDHIFSYLPFKTLVALRSISRHLRSLILSPTFLSDHSFALPSFLLLSHPQSFNSFPLFDPNLHSWRTLPLPRSLSQSCASSLLSSSNGLLCFSLSSSSSSSLAVFNPLTRSSRSLKLPFYPFHFELLSLISSPHGYMIFTLCSSGASRCVCLYDSGDRSWRRFAGADQFIPRGFNQDGVFYYGSLYFARSEPFMIVSVDLSDGKWTTASGDGVFDEITFARLVGDSEKKTLYMVGGIGSNGICRSIKIWEFKKETENWVEAETLPDIVCRKFTSVCYHNYEHVYCLWHKEMICVCCYNWPEILFFNVGEGHGTGFQSVLPCRRNGVVAFAGSLLSRACVLLFSLTISVFIFVMVLVTNWLSVLKSSFFSSISGFARWCGIKVDNCRHCLYIKYQCIRFLFL